MSERLTKEICGFAHGLSGTTVEGALSATGKSWCRGQFEATACVERLFELETAFLDNSGENVIENDRLRELAAAEREGRVVVLPCKVGDTVYVVENKRCGDGSSYVTDFDIYEYPLSLDLFHHLFGRKFYITRQEAEVALSEKIRHTEELRAKICGYYSAAGKGE